LVFLVENYVKHNRKAVSFSYFQKVEVSAEMHGQKPSRFTKIFVTLSPENAPSLMKVFPFKIAKSKAVVLIYQEDKHIKFFDKLHQHEEIQISYVKKGEGSILIGDGLCPYQSGDVLVLGSHLPHVFQNEDSGESSEMHSVFFSPDYLQVLFNQDPDLNILDEFFEPSKFGFKIPQASSAYFKPILAFKDANQYERLRLLLELLQNLSLSPKEQLSQFVYNKGLTDGEGRRLRSVFDYAIKNYAQDISLDDVATVASMSRNAFCRYFKSRTNKTFFQFLIEIRIDKASKALLKNPDLGIAQISEACGFNNLSHFNKHFKAIMKLSPSQYRKEV
jgi:AraC-like DNA-binding protein